MPKVGTYDINKCCRYRSPLHINLLFIDILFSFDLLIEFIFVLTGFSCLPFIP